MTQDPDKDREIIAGTGNRRSYTTSGGPWFLIESVKLPSEGRPGTSQNTRKPQLYILLITLAFFA
jgi:hypothetical protein